VLGHPRRSVLAFEIFPTLELYDSNGDSLGPNGNGRGDQQAEVMANGLAPGNDLESTLLSTLTRWVTLTSKRFVVSVSGSYHPIATRA